MILGADEIIRPIEKDGDCKRGNWEVTPLWLDHNFETLRTLEEALDAKSR